MCRKGNPCTLLVGILIGTATTENSVEVPQKTKTRTMLTEYEDKSIEITQAKTQR